MSEKRGLLINGFGSFYYVMIDGKTYEARARGRIKKENIRLLIGDIVTVEEQSGTYAITGVLPRKNSLIRPAVANVDQIIVVIAAAEPSPNYKQTDKLLGLLEYNNFDVSICINKSDLADYAEIQRVYTNAGYNVTVTSTVDGKTDITPLKDVLKGKISAFAGCSGVGKSSLINMLDENFARTTGEVGKIKRGKHTTTHAALLPLKFGGFIADTPGFSVVDLSEIDKNELAFCFKEFEQYFGQCKFSGCTHINEPGCIVKKLAEEGKIEKSRYESYVSLFEEVCDKKEKFM